MKVANCYIPARVFLLSELRAGASHLVLVCIFLRYVLLACPLGAPWLLCNGLYVTAMFYFQRRLASGIPLRYLSLYRWRTSPHNFRQTSKFLHALRSKDRKVLPTPLPVQNVGGDSKPASAVRLSGERPVVVLTGGERGIGFDVARQLVKANMDVLMCCPFPAEASRAITSIEKHSRSSDGRVYYVELNLADEASIRRAAATIMNMTGRVDILINNAGILSNAGPRRTNARGDELVVSVNFMGPVLFTELLLERIVATGESRIVNVCSLMELNANIPDGYTPLSVLEEHCSAQPKVYAPAYSLSKLLLICYTRDLARRLAGTRVTAACLHPGVVFTAIYDGWGIWSVLMRWVLRGVFKFSAEGGEVVLFCAMADGVHSGGFYADCTLNDGCVSPLAADPSMNSEITKFVYRHFGMDPARL